MPFGTDDGDIPGRVSKPLLLLVGQVVLFVDDDDAGTGEFRPHRRAGADDDRGKPLARRPPGRAPLCFRQTGVGGGYGHREALLETRDGLRREPDLRYQAQGLFAPLDRGLDDAQIDLGLAAPGHALEQEHLESVETGRDLLDGIGLAAVSTGAAEGGWGAWTARGVSGAGGDGAHPPQRAGEGLGHDLPERVMVVVVAQIRSPSWGVWMTGAWSRTSMARRSFSGAIGLSSETSIRKPMRAPALNGTHTRCPGTSRSLGQSAGGR